MEVVSTSEDQTTEIAKKLASKLKKGGLLLIDGDLGTGKTFITKHILKELGIQERKAKSPTYTYIRQHLHDNQKIYHLDLYRINTHDHLLNEEIEELLSHNGNTIIIEWANKMPQIGHNHPHIHLSMEYLNQNSRKITINENN